jgi:hypothetical protein
VALAGWLLGYSVLYCLGPHDFDCAATPSAELVAQVPLPTAPQETQWDAAAPNNLSDAPLVLFQALLLQTAPATATAQREEAVLYAFSVPHAALAEVAAKLEGDDAGVASAAADERTCRETLLALIRRRLQARQQRALAQLRAAAPATLNDNDDDDDELLAWLETLRLDAACEEVTLPLVAL